MSIIWLNYGLKSKETGCNNTQFIPQVARIQDAVG